MGQYAFQNERLRLSLPSVPNQPHIYLLNPAQAGFAWDVVLEISLAWYFVPFRFHSHLKNAMNLYLELRKEIISVMVTTGADYETSKDMVLGSYWDDGVTQAFLQSRRQRETQSD